MADVAPRPALGRPAVIAIGFAVVALLTSAIAAVVVMGRDSAPAPARPTGLVMIERAVAATDVAKLKRDVVALTDGGVTIKDDGLRTALGLEPGDIITALGGRVITREFDVFDAVLGASQLDVSMLYVDIVRAGQPAVVRWKLTGELRAGRRK